ncbi:hypothetical protein [Vibrio chagasii]|uniref:hypothetical protein n=1 Tax=Vibrio chagasii TaxID=170679 RepID=UPI001EFEDE5A|nr:hypothetical protein [Vibrio chagasii]MCG9607968.1 hypothetical protein [Vibrio chagasii]
MNDWNEKLECLNKFLTVSFKVGVLVGGFAICAYSWIIGYFPSGVTIGDGLLFILLATVLSVLVALFSFSFTSLGLALWPLWKLVINLLSKILILINRVTNKDLQINSLPKIRKARAEHYGIAFIGFLFAGFLALQDWRSLMVVLVLLFSSSAMWSSIQENEEEANKQLKVDISTEQKEAILKRVKRGNSILLLSMLLMPLVIPGAPTMLVTGVMRAVDVRVDSATVHIKEPYSIYAEESGTKGQPSNFGASFLKFENAQVLFKGIGSNTVLSLHLKDKDRVQIVVPNSSVHLLPN